MPIKGRFLAGAALGWGAVEAWRAARRGPATVLFDGACPLCRATVARLERWDKRGVLRFQDARESEAVSTRFPDLEPDPDLSEMRLVFGDGAALGGFDAVRALAALLAPLRPLAPLLYLPGVRPLGATVYRLIADNRPLGPGCTEHTCGRAAAPEGAPSAPALTRTDR